MLDTDPTEFLDQAVTLVGIARNAAAGAMVLLSDGTPVFIRGLTSWDRALDRKQVKVEGIQRQTPPRGPLSNAKGEHLHGSGGEELVLEGAVWEEVT